MRQKPPESPSDPVRRNPTSQKITTKEREKVFRKTVIDWKEYFLEFCKVHGEPVEYRNGLLFRDGWRYAMEYSGPEYPPPADHEQLDRLVVTYWTSRLRMCKRSFDRMYVERQRIGLLQSQHSLPLRQVTIVGKGQERKRLVSEFDTRQLDDRLKWLRADIDECEKRLGEIEAYYKERVLRNGKAEQRTGDGR